MKHQNLLSVGCYRHLNNLVGHVYRALLDYDRNPVVDLRAVSAAFAEACINKDLTLVFKGKVPGEVPDAERNLVQAYLEAVRRRQDSEKVPRAVQLDHEDFNELHSTVLGYQFYREAAPTSIGPGTVNVKFAAMLAWWHVENYNSLIAVVEFLQQVSSEHRLATPGETLSAARQELVHRMNASLGDYAKLVLLQGDPADSDEARMRIYALSFSENKLVSQYLSEDRYNVGPIKTSDDEAFRADLNGLFTVASDNVAAAKRSATKAAA